MFCNKNEREDTRTRLTRLIDLDAWNSSLRVVKETLTSLTFAVEFCDTDAYSFNQPQIGDDLYSYLNLTDFYRLTSLEVPIPFLTGDVEFSLTTDIYPLLPPNLQHLSLRSDMSHAQFSYQLETSVLAIDLTFAESQAQARSAMDARMAMAYMFHATLKLLDHAPKLERITVWQPADPSLSWFPGQIEDLAATCRNKSLAGSLVFPMLLLWKEAEHWNLVKEVLVFDPLHPELKHHESLYREQRAGIPLGLATQYHLHALQSHRVRKYLGQHPGHLK
jgi:hypothetical protein